MVPSSGQRAFLINVVIPTYRRPEFLYWALRSVLKQDLDGGTLRVHIVNNDTDVAPVHQAVRRALDHEPAFHRSAAVRVIDRVPPLPPADSWAAAMEECAGDGELLVMHCDDDVMLPGSLRRRIQAFQSDRTGACMLLSSAAGMLFYDRERTMFHVSGRRELAAPRLQTGTARPGSVRDLGTYPGGFFSAYTYAINDTYRTAQQMYRDVLASIDPRFRDGAAIMVPIDFGAVAAVNGALIVDDAPVCARGMYVHEYTAAEGRVAWDAGYLYLSTLAFLDGLAVRAGSDAALRLQPLRKVYEGEAARWVLRFLVHGEVRERLGLISSANCHLLRQLPSFLVGAKTLIGGLLAHARLLPWVRRVPGPAFAGDEMFARLGFPAIQQRDG